MTSLAPLRTIDKLGARGAFALHHADGCHYLFGWSGTELARISGRALRDHSFVNLWRATDRAFLQALLDDVRRFGRPKKVKAQAVSLDGEISPCVLEFARSKYGSQQNVAMRCRWTAPQNTGFTKQPVLRLELVTEPMR